MAVIVQYIVVRNGVEKMTFATKKEADAHDKMLDIADNVFEFLTSSKVSLSDNQKEEISLLLAENAATVLPLLRGAKPQKTTASKAKSKPQKKESAKAGDAGDTAPAAQKKQAAASRSKTSGSRKVS